MEPRKKVLIVSITIFILTISYAVIRYHVLKGVSWDNFPLYIFNKALSLAAVFFIACSYIPGLLSRFYPKMYTSWLPLRKYFGLIGFGTAALHIFISLTILNSAYFPKFFAENGKLNAIGELSLLFGIIAFFIFTFVALISIPSIEKSLEEKTWKRIQQSGYAAFTLVAAHLLVMGINGWLTPNEWPGGLLPISLIAFVVVALTILLKIIVLILPKSD